MIYDIKQMGEKWTEIDREKAAENICSDFYSDIAFGFNCAVLGKSAGSPVQG